MALKAAPYRFIASREIWQGGDRVPRHQHDQAYAAIVLSGGYEESGIRGRFRVGPGDVLLHAAQDQHLDRFLPRSTEILNLNLALPTAPPFWSGRVADPDALARLAERDPASAGIMLGQQFVAASRTVSDWPDLLAAGLWSNPARKLEAWADEFGISSETLSRGFKRVYGTTPATYRAEVRALAPQLLVAKARRALDLIARGNVSLATVAAVAGFADQPHMTRTIKSFTGAVPSA